MSDPEDHYDEAQQLLTEAAQSSRPDAARLLMAECAQARAILALVDSIDGLDVLLRDILATLRAIEQRR